MQDMTKTLQHLLGRNTWSDVTIAGGLFVALLCAALVGRSVLRKQYQRLAATPAREAMELPLRMIDRTLTAFLVIGAACVGASTLEISTGARDALAKVLTIAFFIQAGIWCVTVATGWLDMKRTTSLAHNRAAVGSFGIIAFLISAVVWTIVALLVLDNMGVNITTLVAGLGIGGVAVALAVQNVLGDLLASLSIALDRPFVVGDFVVIDDLMGTVENIGVKSVRIRSLSGEQIIMSNTDLLSSRLRNYGRMHERRVAFTIGVSVDTPHEDLVRMPGMIAEIIEAQDEVRFDGCYLSKLGGAGFEYEVVYFVLSADGKQHMTTQQQIFLAIHAAFEKSHIAFALPTQRLMLDPQAHTSNGSARETLEHSRH